MEATQFISHGQFLLYFNYEGTNHTDIQDYINFMFAKKARNVQYNKNKVGFVGKRWHKSVYVLCQCLSMYYCAFFLMQ